jgi:hypothetical protein
MLLRTIFFWTILLLLTAGTTTSGQSAPAVSYKAIKLTGDNGPYDGEVNGFVFDKRGVGWVSSRDGLFIFDGQKFYRASDYYPGYAKILNSRLSAVLYDTAQNALYLFANIDNTICIYLLSLERLNHSGSSSAAQLIYTERKVDPPQVLVHHRSFYFVFSSVTKLELIGLKEVRRVSSPDIETESIFFSGDSLYGVSWIRSACYSVQFGRDTGIAKIIRKFRSKEEYLDFIGVAAGGGSEANPRAFPNDKVEKITGLVEKVQELPENFFDSKSRVGLAEDRLGNYFIYSGYGIIKLVRQDSYSIQALPAVFETRSIWYNEKEKQGLAATSDGLYRFNLLTKKYDYLVNKNDTYRFVYYTSYAAVNDSSLLFFGLNTDATDILVNNKNYSYKVVPVTQNYGSFSNYVKPGTGEIIMGYDALYSAYFQNDTVRFKEQLFSDSTFINGLAGTGDRLFIATGKGMYNYSFAHKTATLISEGNFLCIMPYKDGWLTGTMNNGIYFISAEGTISEFIATKDGLINNTVYSLLYDETTRLLWAGTKQGLSAYHTAYRVFKNYTVKDGLTNDEFNKLSAYRSPSGSTIIMGGIKGLTVIDNYAITDISLFKKTAPVIMGVDLVYNNDAKDFFSLPFHPEDTVFEVKPLIRSVSLRITKSNSEKIYYLAYKLDKGDWKYTLGDEPVTLYGLGAGSHTIQVKYAGANLEEGPVAMVHFTIKQVWYKQVWAIILFILLFAGILYRVFKWRIDIVEAQSLRELNKDRELMLGVIAHDLRSPVSSYAGLAEIGHYLAAKKDYNKLSEIIKELDENGKHLLLLIDNLLSWGLAKRNLLKYVPENVNLGHLVKGILPLYNNLAASKGMELKERAVSKSEVETDGRALSLILRNLLDNAIKYSRDNSSIELELKAGSGRLEKIEVSSVYLPQLEKDVKELARTLNEKGGGAAGIRNNKLGMTMVRDFVNLLGGQLRLHIVNERYIVTISFPG